MRAKPTLVGSGATLMAPLDETIPPCVKSPLPQATSWGPFLGGGSWSQYGLFYAFFSSFIIFYYLLFIL